EYLCGGRSSSSACAVGGALECAGDRGPARGDDARLSLLALRAPPRHAGGSGCSDETARAAPALYLQCDRDVDHPGAGDRSSVLGGTHVSDGALCRGGGTVGGGAGARAGGGGSRTKLECDCAAASGVWERAFCVGGADLALALRAA